MKKYVIIVAGGKGNRFGSQVPKQFVELCGKPILMWTISAFHDYSSEIDPIVVLPRNQFDFWKELCQKYQFNIPHRLVKGGNERFHSVKNGLKVIQEHGLVAIHDGVRPLIDQKTIEICYAMAQAEGNAIPTTPLVDSLREISADGKNTHVDRNNYRLIQTPQVFQTQFILKAYEQEFSQKFTDDGSVFEAIYPNAIKLVEGNRQNIKITTNEDLVYAEAILVLKNRKE
jgi:2-C-methyl-D-erythritol 4-phosphate cytidylyltransferase